MWCKMEISCILDSMFKLLIYSILALCIFACVDKSDIQYDIRNVMKKQQDAWNSGNLESFMDGYWRSDSLRFLSKDGVTMGWKASLLRYQKAYPSQEAMGQLKFENLRIEVLSGEEAYADGRWNLFRSSDTLSGHFTLLWKRIDGRWLIVSDHSS
jgi:ketosteroid isomerase-like protein